MDELNIDDEHMQDEKLKLKFGKHRNKHICTVNKFDPSYIKWSIRQPRLLTQYQRDFIKKKNIINEDEYIFSFGKHKNKSLDWVKENDKKYIDWLLAQPWVRENCLRLHQLLLENVVEDKR